MFLSMATIDINFETILMQNIIIYLINDFIEKNLHPFYYK